MPSFRILILRAVRLFGNGDEEPGVVAIQAAAVHDVGRDLLRRLAHPELVADQMASQDLGLFRLVFDPVSPQR